MFAGFTRKEFVQALVGAAVMAALSYVFIVGVLLVFQGLTPALS